LIKQVNNQEDSKVSNHQNLFIGVVLYNPNTDEVTRCIDHKRMYGLEVVVWDNTPTKVLANRKDINRLISEGIVVLGEGKNIGLGESINKLCKWAICNGYKWMLTLDQDSFVEKLDIIQLEEISKDDLAWIGTRQHSRKLPLSGNYISIQSGSIVSPRILSDVGGLKAEMFIDHVDHEICLRLQKKQYSVLCKDIIQIKHSVGARKNQFGLNYSTHRINRFRYFVRNGFYCIRKYPEYSLYFIPQLLKEITKQLLQGGVAILFSLITDAYNGYKSTLGVIKLL